MNTTQIVSRVPNLGELKADNSLTKDPEPIYISGRRTAWKEHLIRALSRYCGCTFMTEKDIVAKTTKYYLVGRRYNIVAMRSLWNWLSDCIHENAKADVVGNGRIIVNSYCLGFVEGLEEIINVSPTIIESTKREQEAKHYMRLTHYEVNNISSCNNSNIDAVAFQHGKFKGQSLNLHSLAFVGTA